MTRRLAVPHKNAWIHAEDSKCWGPVKKRLPEFNEEQIRAAAKRRAAEKEIEKGWSKGYKVVRK